MPDRYRRKCQYRCKNHLERLQCSISSRIIPIDSLSFPFVAPALCPKLHRERDNVVVIPAMVARSDDLLAAHRTLGGAFAGLGSLTFAGYEGFHEACVAEEVTLKMAELVYVR